jgi:hypothetical protein
VAPPITLHLARHAETAWTAVIRPWLCAGRGGLERSHVIVPTRGQAHAFKQRCLRENLALLGVEFLTPGLAHQKWRALAATAAPAMGRELLLLGLRTLIARRVAALDPREPAWGFWRSLQSDPERALDDGDELLKAGFAPGDFPLPSLRELFTDLAAWVERLGYALAPVAAVEAGLASVPADAPRLGGRVLVWAGGPELWGEFFTLAAVVRRCADVTAILPEPAFRGEAAPDERWVDLWSALLGVEPQAIDAPEPAATCEAVGTLWTHEGGTAERATVLVGRTRGDEMRLVAQRIDELLASGAENIGVAFPRADAAHLQLAQLLAARGVPFADLLETAGPPAVDAQAQRAMLAFQERGGRIEELLALWPWLRATGAVTLSLGEARRACERSFDACQAHGVAAHLPHWDETAPELARAARLLLPAWPEEITLAEALARFRAAATALALELPEGWGPLDQLAARETAPLPLAAVVAALASFLPAQAPVRAAPGKGGFARVTLGTRCRLEGVAWSHLILVESNAGVWPGRREPSCWLTDEQRRTLNLRGRFSLGLFASDDRAALERAGWRALARDTAAEITFSAALFAEEEPELRLAPNSWLERVLWAQGRISAETGLEAAFAQLAVAAPATALPPPADLADWREVWGGRRDPARPFDGHFFCADPALVAPEKLSAKLIERGVQDPAVLWFEAVLRTPRIAWEPFVRTPRKVLGQQAHALLATALRSTEVTKGFGALPPADEAAARLSRALADLRATWPTDRYWDSFHAELVRICTVLLGNVYALGAGSYVATEAWLPRAAELVLGTRRLPVVGRLDLVLLDRPGWVGANVDIIDFKTGGDLDLSAKRMAHSGASLQLGVYLAGVRSLGAAKGRVWMLKPEPGAAVKLEDDELPIALAKLDWLAAALERGEYGALTPDRSDYAPPGYAWPLACTPVRHAVLRAKHALTFGAKESEAADA